MEKDKKIFCSECYYIEIKYCFDSIEKKEYNCNHPDNIESLLKINTWFRQLKEIKYKKKPKEINKKNNCENFKYPCLGDVEQKFTGRRGAEIYWIANMELDKMRTKE
jgi:hypothetical protein